MRWLGLCSQENSNIRTLQKVGNTIKSRFQKASSAIKKGFQKASSAVKKGFQRVGGAIKAAAQKVKQGFETAGRFIKWFEDHIRRPVSCGQSGQIRPCSRAANLKGPRALTRPRMRFMPIFHPSSRKAQRFSMTSGIPTTLQLKQLARLSEGKRQRSLVKSLTRYFNT